MDPVVESALISAAATFVGVGGTVAVAYMGFRFSRRTLDATCERQIVDGYIKAIKQLGSKKHDVRIGGIYALERIARDSARDHPTVMEVLTAFVREHSRISLRQSRADGAEPEQSPRPDIQAALTAVGRRDSKHDIRPIDLSGAELTDAKLPHGVYLVEAKLARVNLTRVNLTRANFRSADLTGAILVGADLTHADLVGADLDGACPGCEPKTASPAGLRPPTSPISRSSSWPPGQPKPALLTTPPITPLLAAM
jgi:Pentapeptide repeats (8 copies)